MIPATDDESGRFSLRYACRSNSVEGESVSRDYEFSRRSTDPLIAQGYAIAVRTLEERAKRI